jgi:pilus assembly protein FimV
MQRDVASPARCALSMCLHGSGKPRPRRSAASAHLFALLTLVAMAWWWTDVLAVELEPIQLRSGVGEPLLAEVRIRDAPSDLRELSVGLPDPVVFARIGLPRPHAIVGGMRFSVHRGARGEAVIRITTPQPVSEPFLTFLVEVQWRDGSLVREFSVALPAHVAQSKLPPPAVDTVATVREPALPDLGPDPASVDTVHGPTLAPDAPASGSGTQMRVSSPPPTLAARRPPDSRLPPAEMGLAIPVIPSHGPRAPLPRPPSSPSVVPPVHAPGSASTVRMSRASLTDAFDATSVDVVVRRGQHLSGIARNAFGPQASLDRALIALLLANPDAFADGNINRLREGVTLHLPPREMLSAIDAEHARHLVSLHASDREGGDDETHRAAMAAALARIEAGLASRTGPARTAAMPARMQIVPVAAPDAGAPVRMSSSTPLALEHETLAARSEELQHLQARLAALERENDEQRAVIAMQDQALARAQAHLASGPAPGILRAPWGWALCVLAVVAFLLWRSRARYRPDRGNATARMVWSRRRSSQS